MPEYECNECGAKLKSSLPQVINFHNKSRKHLDALNSKPAEPEPAPEPKKAKRKVKKCAH